MKHQTARVGEGKAAHRAASIPGRLARYLTGKLEPWQRVLVGLVGLALLPVMFFPILPLWRIRLIAPQYREGLNMLIYVNDVAGDIDRINILNHYIGMQAVDAATFPEFGYMPWALTLFGGIALLAAIIGRRLPAFLGWIGFAVFGTVMMMHFQGWLVEFGTNLDPKAALDFGAFTPPLLGTGVRGNFHVGSYPSYGGYVLAVAGVLGPLILLADWILTRRRARRLTAVVVALVALVLAQPAQADEFISYGEKPAVSPLQARVEAAQPGDTLRLEPGEYVGQLIIDRPLTLIGDRSAILDGKGLGTVILVQANDVTLRGFSVRNSGYELLVDDAGILIDQVDNTLLEDLRLDNTNHGVYLRNAAHPVLRGLEMEGRRGRVHEENHGNGIHLWYVLEAEIAGNRISGHRDGVYLSFAEAAKVHDNVFYETDRFGLHSMYSQRNIIRDNAFTRNTAGVALMFSNRMEMLGNLFVHNRGHRTYGLLLRDCSDSRFTHNRFIDNTIGLFFDGSNRNVFTENLIAENGWGLIAYSSSENNVFSRNNFMDNDYPVSLDMRRTSNKLTDGTVGNYWSDARPYDLDGNGVGDAPFCPVGLFAFVSKQYPDLTVFSGSPAIVALELAQRAFPSLQLTDLTDPTPMLSVTEIPAYVGPTPPARQETESGSTATGIAAGIAFLTGGVLLAFRGFA